MSYSPLSSVSSPASALRNISRNYNDQHTRLVMVRAVHDAWVYYCITDIDIGNETDTFIDGESIERFHIGVINR